MKAPDKDIREVLTELEDMAEVAADAPGEFDDEARLYRRMETLIRRLAREAGYDLTEIEHAI